MSFPLEDFGGEDLPVCDGFRERRAALNVGDISARNQHAADVEGSRGDEIESATARAGKFWRPAPPDLRSNQNANFFEQNKAASVQTWAALKAGQF
ncbi:MAG TPA: hypothetical protein VEJ39_10570 [Candidatus Acidoferrales bacterium]|nr:hypothetical protein [Candidatus Acidoferrales bacterium]